MAGELEVAGRREDGLDGTHTVVVMELSGQLLGTQPVGRHDLDSQVPGVHESVRVEADLGDHGVVGHHHRHRSKQNLQVRLRHLVDEPARSFSWKDVSRNVTHKVTIS